MSSLHTLNRGPNHHSLLGAISETVGSGDTLLLIEDGVYWSLPNYRKQLIELGFDTIYQLEADALARGLNDNSIQMVKDARFVELVTEHQRSISWF